MKKALHQLFFYRLKERQNQVIYWILLVFLVVATLCFITGVLNVIIFGGNYQGSSLLSIFLIAAIVYGGLKLFQRGYGSFVNTAFLVLVLYCYFNIIYASGIENLFGILMMVFYIIVAAIIFSGRSFFVSVLVLLAVFLTDSILQIRGAISPSLDWKALNYNYADMISIVTVLVLIIFISWLFNFEINNYISKLEKSKKLLQKERDLLEVRVEERTAELKKEQNERIAQLGKFAEFGRLTSGLFHDLINPLTALSLNLNQLEKNNSENLKEFKVYLDGATRAANNIDKLAKAASGYLQHNIEKTSFSVNEELLNVKEILKYKAEKAKVELTLGDQKDVNLFGNSSRFSQVLLNLITNAIEAQKENEKEDKYVIVESKKKDNQLILQIRDNAVGIKTEDKQKIFEPFFSTKKSGGNTGIGLATCKDIIENDFDGKIEVVSEISKGTTFKVTIPVKSI